MDFTNPLVYGVPCFIAFILLELAYSKTHGDEKLYVWKDLFASGFMGVGSAIIAPLIKLISAIISFLSLLAHRALERLALVAFSRGPRLSSRPEFGAEGHGKRDRLARRHQPRRGRAGARRLQRQAPGRARRDTRHGARRRGRGEAASTDSPLIGP